MYFGVSCTPETCSTMSPAPPAARASWYAMSRYRHLSVLGHHGVVPRGQDAVLHRDRPDAGSGEEVRERRHVLTPLQGRWLRSPVSPPTWFDGPVPPESEVLVALLQKAWQGEWYGVRVYGELAAARNDPSETATMLELVVLETYVLGELTVALLSLGIEPDPGPMEAEADVDLAEHVD